MKSNHCTQVLSYMLLLFSLGLILFGEVYLLGAGANIEGLSGSSVAISYVLAIIGMIFVAGLNFNLTVNLNDCSKLINLYFVIIADLCFAVVSGFSASLVYMAIVSEYIFVEMLVLGLLVIACLLAYSVIFVVKYRRAFKTNK